MTSLYRLGSAPDHVPAPTRPASAAGLRVRLVMLVLGVYLLAAAQLSWNPAWMPGAIEWLGGVIVLTGLAIVDAIWRHA